MDRYGNIEANKRGIHNPDAATIRALGKEVVKEKYGNLFDMYKQITGENPYRNSNAYLPCRTLYHGRPVGRL